MSYDYFCSVAKKFNRLKDILTEQGKTQAWLSEQLDVDFKTINRWCSNLNQPPLERLFEIAKALKVNPKELINS